MKSNDGCISLNMIDTSTLEPLIFRSYAKFRDPVRKKSRTQRNFQAQPHSQDHSLACQHILKSRKAERVVWRVLPPSNAEEDTPEVRMFKDTFARNLQKLREDFETNHTKLEEEYEKQVAVTQTSTWARY